MKFYSRLKGDDRRNFIFLHVVFTISGILLLVAGILMISVYYRYLDFISREFSHLAVHLIVLGPLSIVLPVLAYYGFVNGTFSRIAFFIPLIVVLVFELKASVRLFSITSYIYWITNIIYPNAFIDEYDSSMTMWNIVQSGFRCCGMYDYKGWAGKLVGGTRGELPLSCCAVPQNATDFKCTLDGDVYDIGCLHLFGDYLRIFTSVAASLLLIAFILQTASSIPLLRKLNFMNFTCPCSQIIYRRYECSCKSVIFISRDCASKGHLTKSKSAQTIALEKLVDEES